MINRGLWGVNTQAFRRHNSGSEAKMPHTQGPLTAILFGSF